MNSFNISRSEKNIFSNPYNYKKLGWSMARNCYHQHLKRMAKRYPFKFLELDGKELICHDPECYPNICHKKKIKIEIELIKLNAK